ncbi:MAG: phage Gp37/Gp68 family protein [Pseudomonadota bacterium]
MSETTSIEWCRSTFNTHIGCTRISPGCDNCYAAVSTPARVMGIKWGPGEPRRRTSASNWNQVRRWNKQAAASGEFWPVFTASLADVFDNEMPAAWRADFWALVRECPALTFLVLTKRIGNVRSMLPADWGCGYHNVRLGISVVNQVEADRDIPKLMAVPARVRWLSMEPLLGAVDLHGHLWQDVSGRVVHQGSRSPRIDWVVTGGESGAGARPMHPAWPRNLRDQCAAAGVAFLHKQNGEWHTAYQDSSGASVFRQFTNFEQWVNKASSWVQGGICLDRHGRELKNGGDMARARDGEDFPVTIMHRVGKKAAGRLLDGVQHDGYPEAP